VKKALVPLLIAALTPLAESAQRVPACDDLKWSAEVLAANPDIRESCLGVYVRNNTYYARGQIELVRVSGNALTFRPVRRDGSLGKVRRVRVPNSWRANIEGTEYRATDLYAGQRLSVYLPEDRFAMSIHGGSSESDDDLLSIEEAEALKAPEGRK
jgi:hypothetical protein